MHKQGQRSPGRQAVERLARDFWAKGFSTCYPCGDEMATLRVHPPAIRAQCRGCDHLVQRRSWPISLTKLAQRLAMAPSDRNTRPYKKQQQSLQPACRRLRIRAFNLLLNSTILPRSISQETDHTGRIEIIGIRASTEPGQPRLGSRPRLRQF